MRKISELISKELFMNSFFICREVCNDEIVLDGNLRIIKDTLSKLSDKKVIEYYERFVKTDALYSLPELFTTDIVSIPKNLTGVREYRYFSTFAYILYNAIGLLFVDCTNDLIGELSFGKKNIHAFYPTRFVLSDEKGVSKKWRTKNNYKEEYRNFTKKLENILKPDDIILKLDISAYFETIIHARLIDLLRKLSPESALKAHNYEIDSSSILEFYFESLMQRKYSIPQGRKNLVSDYFGYLYLVPFDLKIHTLVQSDRLQFKGMIRYVDDIFIIFNKNSGLSKRDIFSELLKIEVKINSWLQKKYGLQINSAKTVREVIKDEDAKKSFIEEAKKTISSPDEQEGEKGKPHSKKELSAHLDNFLNALSKFRYNSEYKFTLKITKEDKENLKLVFDKGFQNHLFETSNTKLVVNKLKDTEFELVSDHINILIVLFYLERSHKNPFKDNFEQFIKSLNGLKDKRLIHILLVASANSKNKKIFFDLIKKNAEDLAKDNYGKYLALIYGHFTAENCYPFSVASVYNRLVCERLRSGLPKGRHMYHAKSDAYIKIIETIVTEIPEQESLIRQLKYFIFNYSAKKWDQAFNYFQNTFHEICKIKFSLKDTCSIHDVIKKIKCIDIKEELLIRKFYKRRNFNSVSHPSQKGIPTVAVNESDLHYYLDKILPIMSRILD